MILKKFATYFYYVGCLVFAIGCIANILVKHTSIISMSRRATAFLMLAGIVLMAVDWIYKLCHFSEYKKENKDRLIKWVVIVVGMLLLIYIKTHL
ncbi:MAG: hypothetical protein IJK37_01285 [Prevotella sp.]|nr:hypothetical protein [Prevotella sp.]